MFRESHKSKDYFVMKFVLCFFVFILGLSFLQDAWAKSDTSFHYLQAEIRHENLLLKIYTEEQSLPFNQLHTWQLVIEDEEGKSLSELSVSVDGGMDGHSHGLPTSPRVSLNNEAYLIQGLKFQMPGEWFLNIHFKDNDKKERHIHYTFPVLP